MRWFAGTVSFLALLIVLLPNLGADDKKDAAKPEAKAVDKKDAEKKEAAKGDTKNAEDKTKKKEPKKEPEEKVVYGEKLTGKLRRLDANSARYFAIEVAEKDPKKVYQLDLWKASEVTRIMSSRPGNVQQAAQRAQDMASFQLQLARKLSTEIYTKKDKELRAADQCKVRTAFPPVEFDLKGRQKTYTQKELNALKGTSKLPGYPAEFDQLAVGQVVTAYLAKTKTAGKKKNADDDDEVMAKPDVVMILVVKEAPVQK